MSDLQHIYQQMWDGNAMPLNAEGVAFGFASKELRNKSLYSKYLPSDDPLVGLVNRFKAMRKLFTEHYIDMRSKPADAPPSLYHAYTRGAMITELRNLMDDAQKVIDTLNGESESSRWSAEAVMRRLRKLGIE